MGDRTLDITKPQKVSYCIPDWLRDEQIRINCQKVKARLEPGPDRTEPIALACFGPSLNDTWKELSQFKYVISCSGAHKFLVDRGVMPTWHLEVDPRPHKIALIGPPQKNVEYLIASACHPAVFDHLKDFNVKIWHVYNNKEDALRTIPYGEWAMLGGLNVGLRAMTVARFLGFKELHVFGMDGSFRPDASGSHADVHGNSPRREDYFTTVYDGVTYHTTPPFLEAARQTFHELNQIPDAVIQFHGDGLVQHMARNYQRTPLPPGTPLIAFIKPALISDYHRDLNAKLHHENAAYGVGGGKHAETVLKIANALKTQSILDYGCGKGYLAKAIPFPIWEYDPAIPGKDAPPRPADLVVCADVLEHVEPELLDGVILDLARVTRKIGYYVIHIGPAKKVYADGRNTHLIQKSPEWWIEKLESVFKVSKTGEMKSQTGEVYELRLVVSLKKTVTLTKPMAAAAAVAETEAK